MVEMIYTMKMYEYISGGKHLTLFQLHSYSNLQTHRTVNTAIESGVAFKWNQALKACFMIFDLVLSGYLLLL